MIFWSGKVAEVENFCRREGLEKKTADTKNENADRDEKTPKPFSVASLTEPCRIDQHTINTEWSDKMVKNDH